MNLRDAGQTSTENCVGTRAHCCAMHTLPSRCWGIRDGSCSCGQSRGTFPMSLFMSRPERGRKEGEEGTDCRAPGQECCSFSWIFYWSGISEVNTLKNTQTSEISLHFKYIKIVSTQPPQPPTTHKNYNPWTGNGIWTNPGASLLFFPRSPDHKSSTLPSPTAKIPPIFAISWQVLSLNLQPGMAESSSVIISGHPMLLIDTP